MVKSKVIDNEYLILSDEDESSLNVHAAALKYFYGGRIITSTSHDETIDLLNRHGRPELLFVDYNLLIKEQESSIHLSKVVGFICP